MKFSSVIYILVLFGLTRSMPLPKSNNAKGMGHETFSESQRQVLLYRLDHAAGDEHQLGFFKMLLSSQNSVGSCKEQGNCIEDIVNTIEQVALWYTINLEARNLTALRQAKYYTEQLKDVERDYQTRLNSLPEPFKYWHALSMNESISSFLSYELKKLQRLQLELLVAGEFNSVWIKIGEISAHCFAAVQSGVKTFQIMGFNFDANQKATNKLASWFHFQYDSQVVKRLFRDNFNVGKRDESPPRDIAADMNYLREGLSITIKAGMFLLLCMQYQVYLCSVAFGFMISMSCFIWISVYLEMLSTTV